MMWNTGDDVPARRAMSALLAPQWIADLVQSYGLWVVFAVVMLESAGLPLPGETALVTTAVRPPRPRPDHSHPSVASGDLACDDGGNIADVLGQP